MKVNISNKNLTKIPEKYKDKVISGDFYCFNNELTSLENAPKKVDRSFICSNNNLTSLKGAPKEVGEDFDISSNLNLTKLQYLPQKIKGDFLCYSIDATLKEIIVSILKTSIDGIIISSLEREFINKFYKANNHEKIKLIFGERMKIILTKEINERKYIRHKFKKDLWKV